MGHNEPVIGLSISPFWVRAIAIDRDGPQSTLRAIDEWPVTFPLSVYDTANPLEACNSLAADVDKFSQTFNTSARRVSVAIDSSLLFLEHIPIQHSIDRRVLQKQMIWEIGSHFPDEDARNFIVDTHVMPRQTAPGVDNVLVVAIRRSLASAVEKALALADLSVAIVDVDHFSADVALRLNYPDTSMRYVALAAIKEQRLDISFLRNGTLESYHYHVLSSPADSVDILGALSHDFPELSSILIYGSACDEELLAQIREAASGIVDIMNPLRHVGTSDSFYPAEHLTAGSYRFAPAIGVALRRD